MNEVNEYQASKAQKASILRYTGLVLVILNAILSILDMPLVSADVWEVITIGLLAAVGLFVGYRNNYLTRRGKKQAEVLAARDLLKK